MRAAISRISLLGLIKAAIVIIPVSIKSLETSAIRRIFSTLSASEKPKLLFIPVRMLSPSGYGTTIHVYAIRVPKQLQSYFARSAQTGKPNHHAMLPQESFFILPGQHPVEYWIYVIIFFHYNMLDVVSVIKTARLKESGK